MSRLLVPFFYELRRRRLPVGTGELVVLARAVKLGLHGSTLDGFYHLARALLVHRDQDLDHFDQAFLAHFRRASEELAALEAELEAAAQDPARLSAWLEGPPAERGLTEREIGELLGATPDALEAALAGDAPAPDGAAEAAGQGRIPVRARRAGFGPGGGRAGTGALGVADARRYRRYRSDLTLDVRDVEVTLRRLRTLVREGHRDELDLEGTLDATARAFGDLEIVLRARRRSGVRVLLLMDVGGSMEPHARLCSQLFSAARRSSSLRELRTYYFHNVVYGKVWSSDGAMTPVDVTELLGAVNRRWKLVLLGDAQMAPGELLSVGPFGSSLERPGGGPMRGFDWLVHLAEQFDRTAWLNPDPPAYWVGGTVEVISQVFRMYQLSLDGLTRAFTHLSSDAPEPRLEFRGNPRNAL